MAEYKVVYSQKAFGDLYDIALFVASRDGVERADALIADIEAATTRLVTMPYSGSLEKYVYVKNPGYRFLVVKNHIIHYHIDAPANTVYIDTVKYGAVAPENQLK